MDGAERFTLATGLVERGGEQGPAPLAERRLRHERASALQHRRPMTQPYLRLDAQLLGLHPEALEPGSLDPPRLPLLDVGERPTAPEAEAFLHQEGGTGRVVPDKASRPRSSRRSNSRWSSSSSPSVRR